MPNPFAAGTSNISDLANNTHHPATLNKAVGRLKAGDKVYVYFTSGKFCAVFPEGSSPDGDDVEGGVHYAALTPLPAAPEKAKWNEAVIRLASEFERTVTFQYQKAKGPGGIIELRSLRPDDIRPNKQGDLVVYGEDGDRQEIRGFRLDRIVGHVSVAGGRR